MVSVHYKLNNSQTQSSLTFCLHRSPWRWPSSLSEDEEEEAEDDDEDDSFGLAGTWTGGIDADIAG